MLRPLVGRKRSTTKQGQAPEKAGKARVLPANINMAQPAGEKDEVEGTITHYLIGDLAPVGRTRVARLRFDAHRGQSAKT